MQFGDYLRECRIRLQKTQTEMIEALYLFDDRLFDGLNGPTFSKWERNVSQPPPLRIAGILRYLQEQEGGVALPCLDQLSRVEIERLLCQGPLEKLLGRSKTISYDLDLDSLDASEYRIIPLRHFERSDELLEIHQVLHQNANPSFAQVPLEKFKQWSVDPMNFFYVLLYKNSLLGLLFALSLTEESFDELIKLRKRKVDLGEGDFAGPGQRRSIYILSSFSLDKGVLVLLFSRLYAHMIANQKEIDQVGLITSQKDVESLADRMNLRHRASRVVDETESHSYSAALTELILGEEFIRAFFPSSKSCPER